MFYRLSQKCLNINWAEYIFEVCPYKRISQFKAYKNKGLKRNLGTDSVLILGEILNQKIWILKMGNGDREFCSQPRESEVNIGYYLNLKYKFILYKKKLRSVLYVGLKTALKASLNLKNVFIYLNI